MVDAFKFWDGLFIQQPKCVLVNKWCPFRDNRSSDASSKKRERSLVRLWLEDATFLRANQKIFKINMFKFMKYLLRVLKKDPKYILKKQKR